MRNQTYFCVNWFVEICDLSLIFNGIRCCGLKVVGLRNGRKALRDPPPTKRVFEGRKGCLWSLFLISLIDFDEDFVVFGGFTFDDKFLSFLSLVKVICRDGSDFFGLGGTTATGGIWLKVDFGWFEGGK